jgi:hypothetical protein
MRKWTALLRRLQKAAASGGGDVQEFSYLRHAAPHALPFNPFDLEVRGFESDACARGRRCWTPPHPTPCACLPVSQVATYAEVAALPVYFTASTTGVTRTVRAPATGAAEFTGLDRFLREQQLHAKLMRLAVFRWDPWA